MVNLAVNGFGRIGRVALRVALTRYLERVKIVAVNTSGSMDAASWAQLFEYDSVYGKFKGKVECQSDKETKLQSDEIGVMTINNQRIPILAQREPAKIPWKKYDVGVVIESTGVFRDRKSALAHLEAGAKKVIVSAQSKKPKEIETYIIGVNENEYRGQLVIDNASCTTNCVAPVVKVVLENFGVQKAHMTTIHAVTADQELVDGSHQDLRRARAAAWNIIPTSTGAIVSLIEVLPSLKGLLDGLAYRVPIICGSVVDFTFLTTKRASIEAINQIFQKAAQGKYKGIIEASDKPLVSTDIIGNSASAIVDLSLTQVVDGDLVKVVAWYDNEWGYCCRLIEMVAMIGSS